MSEWGLQSDWIRIEPRIIKPDQQSRHIQIEREHQHLQQHDVPSVSKKLQISRNAYNFFFYFACLKEYFSSMLIMVSKFAQVFTGVKYTLINNNINST